MQFCWTPVFLALFVAGIPGLKLPGQEFILSADQIDDISDYSSDIILASSEQPAKAVGAEGFLDEDPLNVPAFQNPKIYGMNIGLHFILEDINRRLVTGDRVHLESLIKVLVLTHNIEKLGGTINENNRLALKSASRLYPVFLREAMGS